MAASLTDFTGLDVSGNKVFGGADGDISSISTGQWYGIARAVQALTAYFQAKESDGTEPNDTLTGIVFGDDDETKKWRIINDFGDAGQLKVQENTGSDASPSWTTVAEFASSGFTFSGDLTVEGNLSVKNTADSLQRIIIDPGTSAAQIGAIRYSDQGTALWDLAKTKNGVAPNTGADNDLVLYDVDGTTIVLTVKQATNRIGVGTTSPSVPFEVSGAAKATTLDTTSQNIWTKLQGSTPVALTAGANVSIDLSDSNVFTLSLSSSGQLDNPSNIPSSGSFIIIVTQSGGGNSLSFDTKYKFIGGSAPTISSGAGEIDILTCVTDGTDVYVVEAQNFS